MYFKVDIRAVRELFTLLLSQYNGKIQSKLRASGISPEHTELDDALEDISQRMKECEKEQPEATKENDDKTKKKKREKLAAEDIQQKALETYAETSLRKFDESQKSKKDPSVHDLIHYNIFVKRVKMNVRLAEKSSI